MVSAAGLAVYRSLVLKLPERALHVVQTGAILAVLLQSAFWASELLRFSISHYLQERRESDPGLATAISAMSFIGNLVLWSVVVLLALDNIGFDVTALVAGLGVGGIAVALAAQNILGDLFASLSIVIDKPFVLGDFIIVGDKMGTVETVGLKTTRLRSLTGEQLVFANTDLLSSRVQNYKRKRMALSLPIPLKRCFWSRLAHSSFEPGECSYLRFVSQCVGYEEDDQRSGIGHKLRRSVSGVVQSDASLASSKLVAQLASVSA